MRPLQVGSTGCYRQSTLTKKRLISRLLSSLSVGLSVWARKNTKLTWNKSRKLTNNMNRSSHTCSKTIQITTTTFSKKSMSISTHKQWQSPIWSSTILSKAKLLSSLTTSKTMKMQNHLKPNCQNPTPKSKTSPHSLPLTQICLTSELPKTQHY